MTPRTAVAIRALEDLRVAENDLEEATQAVERLRAALDTLLWIMTQEEVDAYWAYAEE